MAVVVEQTIPFTPSTLDLENSTRWNTLFPLIRPTVKSVQTSKGQTILIDMSKSKGKKYLHIVAVGNIGNFSSKLLDDRHVTAIVTEKTGAGILTAGDLPQTLRSAGVDVGQGVVMVRAAGKEAERKVVAHAPDVLEVVCEGELAADHAMHLMGTARGGTRANPHTMAEMLKGFVKNSKSAEGWFRTEKVEGKPAVLMHSEGSEGFGGAKEVVRRGLERAMQEVEVEGKGEDVVYSVHFSDVNGLSRLENYIIAGEIAEFLDSQNLPYTLSHSTILSHTQLSRGFSISICPIPHHFLDPSPKPVPHQSSTTKSTTNTTTQRPSSQIPFSDPEIRAIITSGCKALITAEPTITSYDTIVGDGDCGTTLRSGAQTVLTFISTRNLQNLPSTLADLVCDLEISMGGTSGALYCIFLTALSNSLASAEAEGKVSRALRRALEELCKYTKARVGDRTLMDALIPFVENFERLGGEGAVGKAREGVERTREMVANLGRSTYLDEKATQGVPDPGAFGLGVLLGGMVEGSQKQ